jgi:hypothetical protein
MDRGDLGVVAGFYCEMEEAVGLNSCTEVEILDFWVSTERL